MTTKKTNNKSTKWSELSKNVFKASNDTFPTLQAGTYEIQYREGIGIVYVKRSIKTDKLIEFPDMVQDDVVRGIEDFWQKKEIFKRFGQLHKRGVFIYGPPGSGKTCTVNLLSKKLTGNGGIVIYCNNPHLATQGLQVIRSIEPERPIIYVMEDIDEMLRQYGESALLSLLDGENKVENIVFVATSNYPEMLSERFLDRPSRFDERIEVGMPSAQARAIYLRSVLSEDVLTNEDLRYWVADTENFSIAHLRELFVSVICLGRDYTESIVRLKGMSTLPKSKMRKKSSAKFGFDGNKAGAAKSIEEFYAEGSAVPSVLVPVEAKKK